MTPARQYRRRPGGVRAGEQDAADRMDAAHAELVAAVEQLSSSQDWVQVLEVSRRLPQYSARNCLLLAVQGAQGMVMGYKAWQQIPSVDGGHCQVRRGATGLKVLAPVTRSITETDADTGDETRLSKLVGFKLISVFDQTALVSPPDVPTPEAPALLEGDAPAQLWDALAVQVDRAGFGLLTDPESGDRIRPANGQTDFLARLVAVRPDLPPAQQTKTLAHELGHVLLHDPQIRPPGVTREVAEVEAESVAWLVTRELGLDASAYSIPYVTGWASGNPDLVLAAADRAIATARRISDAVHAHLQPPSAGTPQPETAMPETPTATGQDGELNGPARRQLSAGRAGPFPGTPSLAGAAGAGGDDMSVLDDGPEAPAITAGQGAGEPSGEPSGETSGEPSGAVAGDPIALGVAADGASRNGGQAVLVDSPAGQWRLGWDQRLGSFTGTHRTHGPAGDGPGEDYWVGRRPGEVASVGALEERLGWALPADARAWLGQAQQTRPALPTGRDFSALYPGAAAAGPPQTVPASATPVPSSLVRVPGQAGTSYGAALDQEPVLRSWAGAGFGVTILSSEVTGRPPLQEVTYRITHHGFVVFSGDDVQAPLEDDLREDTALQNLVAQVCTPHADIPLSPAQVRFITEHAERLDKLIHPQAPYPAGARIQVTSSGHRLDAAADAQQPPAPAVTGVVIQPITDDAGHVTSYAWRPDVAELPGHPWEDNPGHTMISAAEQVHSTLAGPDTALTGWTPDQPLTYGAEVTFTADDGQPIPAMVLRAYRTNGATDHTPTSTVGSLSGLVYDLQPLAAGTEPIRLPAGQVTAVSGTAWPSIRALVEARDRTEVALLAGEVLAAGGQLAYTTSGPDGITLTPRPDRTIVAPTPTGPGPAPARPFTSGPPDAGAALVPLPILGRPAAADGMPTPAGGLDAPDSGPPTCATPECGGPAASSLSTSPPGGGPGEITLRCQPCTGRLVAARLADGHSVVAHPLPGLGTPPPTGPAVGFEDTPTPPNAAGAPAL